MPLTLTLTEGVLPIGAEKKAIQQLTDAMLKWHNLTGNTVMTPNVTAHLIVLPKAPPSRVAKSFPVQRFANPNPTLLRRPSQQCR